MNNLHPSASCIFLISALAFLTNPLAAGAQSLDLSSPPPSAYPVGFVRTASTDSSSLALSPSPDPAGGEPADVGVLSPDPPEPAEGGGRERSNVAADANWRQQPFSRIGIGADVSPLGIGIKSGIVLNHFYDARFDIDFFNYDTGRFEVEGFNVDANLHMASARASVDWYPMGSIWRISPGIMLFNGNQLTGKSDIVPGASVSLGNRTYFSANTNPATGATPLSGTGGLNFHTNSPAFTIAGGFGKFIPRSDRHWSFPTEFGVVFMGAPTLAVNLSGWACLDAKLTQCSNIGDPKNPIAIEFNDSLNTTLNRWRKDLDKVTLYPIFSTAVVYSFNIR